MTSLSKRLRYRPKPRVKNNDHWNGYDSWRRHTEPGVYSEIDNSKAVRGPQPVSYRRLLIGQKLASAPAAANTLIRITSPAQADTQFGKGSMLAGMVRAAMAIDTYTELQVLPVIDNVAGAAAGHLGIHRACNCFGRH